jgi:hypothetical protein
MWLSGFEPYDSENIVAILFRAGLVWAIEVSKIDYFVRASVVLKKAGNDSDPREVCSD